MKALTLAKFADRIFSDHYYASTMSGGNVKRGTLSFASAHLDRLQGVASKAEMEGFQATISDQNLNGWRVLTINRKRD